MQSSALTCVFNFSNRKYQRPLNFNKTFKILFERQYSKQVTFQNQQYVSSTRGNFQINNSKVVVHI